MIHGAPFNNWAFIATYFANHAHKYASTMECLLAKIYHYPLYRPTRTPSVEQKHQIVFISSIWKAGGCKAGEVLLYEE